MKGIVSFVMSHLRIVKNENVSPSLRCIACKGQQLSFDFCTLIPSERPLLRVIFCLLLLSQLLHLREYLSTHSCRRRCASARPSPKNVINGAPIKIIGYKKACASARHLLFWLASLLLWPLLFSFMALFVPGRRVLARVIFDRGPCKGWIHSSMALWTICDHHLLLHFMKVIFLLLLSSRLDPFPSVVTPSNGNRKAELMVFMRYAGSKVAICCCILQISLEM